jgi:RNA polymerase sigma factor (sigma-70 family)
MDDAAILAASVTDPETFTLIFDRHAPTLHRYVVRRLGPEVAEDVVAEVFLAAFRRRTRYDQAYGDARPWLYGIASNEIAQHRRQEARRWRLLAELAPDPATPDHADPADARVSAQAARPALARALGRLSRGEREVLLLLAWEELSYEEIATALDIPIGTVRSRLSRARAKLRPAFTAHDPELASIQELFSNE